MKTKELTDLKSITQFLINSDFVKIEWDEFDITLYTKDECPWCIQEFIENSPTKVYLNNLLCDLEDKNIHHSRSSCNIFHFSRLGFIMV